MSDNIPFETKATGYRPPRPNQPLPELVVIHSQAAFDRRLGSLRNVVKDLQRVAIDWNKEVALWASCAVGAGMDHTPEVKSLTLSNNVPRLVISLLERPDPQRQDIVTQPWILVSTPKGPFEARDRQIVYIVDGQGEGKVLHDE